MLTNVKKVLLNYLGSSLMKEKMELSLLHKTRFFEESQSCVVRNSDHKKEDQKDLMFVWVCAKSFMKVVE